ncbi:MAG TPA: pilus assembly protein PilM [Candidatus Omnitrophota bacterium]|nr:pilus assembly protein PilM [Candidatus Omnitrophota bacterium]
MSSNKNIGIFWGSEFLSIAETQRDQLTFAGAIPMQSPELLEQPKSAKEAAETESLHLISALQRLNRDRQINKHKVHLSIPVRDIIFRSFTLPSMSTAEIENAVIFEAPRYIPFKMDELFFSHHAIPFVDKDIKKIQILFIAIRKNTLNHYCKTLEDAGLQIASAEPSALSLLRILAIKKLLKPSPTIAIIQIREIYGSILIADGQIPQFIRDFNLFSSNTAAVDRDFKSMISRLLNEIRLSLEFYARQAKSVGREKPINQIFIFAPENSREISQAIKTDLGFETLPIDINNLFPYDNELHQNLANAIGVSFAGSSSLNFDLNLAKSRKGKTAHSISSIGFQDVLTQPPNYKLTTMIAFACAGIVTLSFLGAGLQVLPQEKRLGELRTFEQKYKGKSTEQLSQSTADLAKKMNDYSNLKFRTNINMYIENVSRSMFDGVWLTELSISARDPQKSIPAQQQVGSAIAIKLTGYSYHQLLNQQITLIEKFLDGLKKNAFLMKHSKSINLAQVKKEEREGFAVTSFQISIETDNAND